MGLWNKLLHAGEGKKLKALQAIIPEINAFEPELEPLSDDELAAKTPYFRQRLANGEDLDDLLPEAFAVVRETGRRVLGQRHYDEQMLGGCALHLGWVAEMKTGEGKTLVSTLPAYLNGLPSTGVHLVTVNDYLAKRDAEWMGRIHRFLGLTIGLIIPGMHDAALKRQSYNADITYGTNNEFGFDYLRDNMASSRDLMVQQRGHCYAIVDEVDSILIDEARTPLIISGPVSDAAALYVQFARIIRGLERDRDYEVDEKKRSVAPTEEGVTRIEAALGVENLYDNVNQNFVHQVQAALRAKELFKRDVDYVIADGEVKIVDEFTGRILEGRRWSEGLHQAVEAKEGVRIKEENQTLATITLQNYFRLYEKLAGMTGTGVTEAGEFAHTYNLEVVPIPTHKPMIRADEGDLIYKTEDGKFGAVVEDIAGRHEKGQPVLIGTISVEKSEKLSRQLDRMGIPNAVLNAKQHEMEAVIVTQAGRIGSVTVATNMAGRGVDIILGGNHEGLAKQELAKEGFSPEDEPEKYTQLLEHFKAECKAEQEEVLALGGLYVLGTERHESRRIDNQLRGRSGRQGDPGESRFYLSLEDDLMRIFATGAMNWVMGKALPDDVPIEAKMVSKAIERAQGTVEDRNFEIRKDVLKYDEVMNEQRKVIYKRRQQVLDGEDLRDQALEAIQHAVGHAVDTFCPSDFPEEWDLPELVRYATGYFPTTVTAAQLNDLGDKGEITEVLTADALAKYEEKEQILGAEQLRDIERRVMLSVIDQKWREHLYEMDYLQEGINLRAMGQKDPLTEWRREGFDMFEAMIAAVEDDFVRYVFHLKVVREEPPPPPQAAQKLTYSAPEGPVQGAEALRSAGMAEAAAGGEVDAEAVAAAGAPAAQAPVTAEKTQGRNEPCECGSGKKYKFCHGR